MHVFWSHHCRIHSLHAVKILFLNQQVMCVVMWIAALELCRDILLDLREENMCACI